LFIGSGSILSNLLKYKIRNLDAYAGLSIPLFHGKRPKKQPKTNTSSDTAAKKEIKPTDRDQDGLSDVADECPDVAGIPALKGCPDSDGDGVADKFDHCPDVLGLIKYYGCPPPDTDKDGIMDEEDLCPQEAGSPSNHGCPDIKQEINPGEKQKLDSISNAFYFATGKAILRQKSITALNQLVGYLKSDPKIQLLIEGHTDSRGTKAINRSLSQKRAQNAKAYLISKGIESTRISTIGYGSSMPVANNLTVAGRAANRRIVIIRIR
jgi:outer membrane protein OmpA-like peptidoglycan-associated protein